MHTFRSDRVVRVLTTVVSIAYFGLWGVAAVALLAAPAVKLLAAGHPEWVWGLKVPATVLDSEATVRTSWGAAHLVVGDVRGSLHVPIAMLPWWLVTLLWTHLAIMFGLMLASLYQLRRIFQRVRDGVPFDAHNALRMRRLGVMMLALASYNAVAEFVTSRFVRDALVSRSIAMADGPRVDFAFVFVALVVVALAEIFRRGAELEREQSLVI
jgi:hypothetical protein